MRRLSGGATQEQRDSETPPWNLGSFYNCCCSHKPGAITGHTGSLVEPGPETSPPTVSGPAVSQPPPLCHASTGVAAAAGPFWGGCPRLDVPRAVSRQEGYRELTHTDTCMHRCAQRMCKRTPYHGASDRGSRAAKQSKHLPGGASKVHFGICSPSLCFLPCAQVPHGSGSRYSHGCGLMLQLPLI